MFIDWTTRWEVCTTYSFLDYHCNILLVLKYSKNEHVISLNPWFRRLSPTHCMSTAVNIHLFTIEGKHSIVHYLILYISKYIIYHYVYLFCALLYHLCCFIFYILSLQIYVVENYHFFYYYLFFFLVIRPELSSFWPVRGLDGLRMRCRTSANGDCYHAHVLERVYRHRWQE